jgi:hypothetical protein
MAEAQRDPTQPLTAERVRREVLAEALQHPLTLYPFGAAALAAVYALAASPVFGATLPALAIALGGGLVAVGSFGWHYFVRGPDSASLKAREQIALHEREVEARRQDTLQDMRDELARRLGGEPAEAWLPARRALEQLTEAYDRLVDLLAQRRGSRDATNVGLLAGRAEETCRQGLSLLVDVADAVQVVAETDRDELATEIADLERRLAAAGDESDASERVRIWRERLASHGERLAALDAQQLRIERLLAQVDACEAALERVRLGLPGLNTGIQERVAQDAADRLTRTIETARRQQQMAEAGQYDEIATAMSTNEGKQHG